MAGEDPAYLGRVAALPCAAAGELGACLGPVQAHHRITGRVRRQPVKGGDRRAHDHDALPICTGHHDALHGSRGAFRTMGRRQLEAWEDTQIERTQRTLGLPPEDERTDHDRPDRPDPREHVVVYD